MNTQNVSFLQKSTAEIFENLDPSALALPLDVTGIPHFSLNDWYKGGQAKARLKHHMAMYWRVYGFVSTEDVTIEQAKLYRAYEAVEKFFELPDDVKMKYCNHKIENGYTPRAGEGVPGKKPDDKEFFHFHGIHWKDDIIPIEIVGFEKAFRDWFEVMRQQAEIMLEVAAYVMGEDLDYLLYNLNNYQTVMRALHYFNDGLHPERPLSAAHEDINFITGLPPSVGRGKDKGLWCKHPFEDKIYSPNLENIFRIIWNLGNMACMRYHGILRDVTHGVDRGLQMAKNTFSMPFFVHNGRDFPLVTVKSLQQGYLYLLNKEISIFNGNVNPDHVLLNKGKFFDWRLKEINSNVEIPDCSLYAPEQLRLSDVRAHLINDCRLTPDEVNKHPLFGRGFFPESFPAGISQKEFSFNF